MDEQDAPEWFTAPRREHEARLVVGAKVRVKLSGECPACTSDWCKEYHGLKGEIYAIGTSYIDHLPRSHIYGVTVRYEHRGGGIMGTHFAAEELELISDRDDVPRSAPGRGDERGN